MDQLYVFVSKIPIATQKDEVLTKILDTLNRRSINRNCFDKLTLLKQSNIVIIEYCNKALAKEAEMALNGLIINNARINAEAVIKSRLNELAKCYYVTQICISNLYDQSKITVR